MYIMSNNYGFEPTLDGLNNIDADSTITTDIICDNLTVNVSATAPTMTSTDNSTHLATTAFVTTAISGAGASYVTLGTTQTISGQKTFSNANTIVSGTLKNDSLQGSTTVATQNIATTQTSGILNIANLAGRTGAININTGATATAVCNISNNTTNNAHVNIGSINSTTQNVKIHSADLRLNTDFLFGPDQTTIGGGMSHSVLSVSANTFFGGNIELATGNITTTPGVNAFLTTTGLTDDINIDSANDMNLDCVNDLNVTSHSLNINAGVGGIGIVTTGLMDITSTETNIYSSSGTTYIDASLNVNITSQNLDVTIQSYTGNVTTSSAQATTLTSNLDMNLTSTTGKFVFNVVDTTKDFKFQSNSINKLAVNNTKITHYVPTVNSGLTYPLTTTSQLGYFTSATSTTKFTNSLANLSSLSLPEAGCYLVEGQFQFASPYTAVSYTSISLSTTSVTQDKKRQMTIPQPSAGGYGNRLTSIFNVTATTTVYLVGISGVALGATALQDNYISVTRIA